MRWFFILLLSVVGLSAQTYTEFYCQTTADNLNAGSTKEDAANTTYGGGTFVRATGVFTVASGNPTSDPGVTNGAWASIYTTSGATIATCVGRITNTTANTLTIDIGTVSGATANVSETAAAATAKVGGAWKGPNAAVGLPFGFIATNSINAASVWPRVNFKNGVNYAITAAMTHSLNGIVVFQGYTSSPGDGGRATIDGGTSGASYILLTANGTQTQISDLIFQHNGSTGIQAGVNASGTRLIFTRCVFNNIVGSGLSFAANTAIACEAYTCNTSNTGDKAGFQLTSGLMVNCNSHDNATAKAHGASPGANAFTMVNCSFSFNGSNGVYIAQGGFGTILNCDFYGNTGAAVEFTSTATAILNVLNCNFVKNGRFGISNSIASRMGFMRNCGFGSGTMANGGADTVNMGAISVSGSFSYPANTTPWVDPDNENFTLKSGTLARAGGWSEFTQTEPGFGGTVAYPDVGAAQAASTNSAGGSYTFSQ